MDRRDNDNNANLKQHSSCRRQLEANARPNVVDTIALGESLAIDWLLFHLCTASLLSNADTLAQQ